MATSPQNIPATPMPARPPGNARAPLSLLTPQNSKNASQPFGLSPDERQKLANDIVKRHREGKEKRLLIDLTREKFLHHVGGEGDAQWADIWNGSRVVLPLKMSNTIRLQENLERPLLENFVAYHTAMEMRFAAISSADKKSRDRARIDTIFANSISQTQRLNRILAAAMMVAGVYGNCPVHVQWRSDANDDSSFDPIYTPSDLVASFGNPIGPGYIDIFVGDPWGTVYNEGATRTSVQRVSYDKVYSTDRIKKTFEYLPYVAELKGRKDLPSASRFQRIARLWQNLTPNHGSSAMNAGTDGEELSGIICEETAPGVDPAWPKGKLAIVALSGAASADKRENKGTGTPMLLHVGALPAARFSCIRFYAGYSFDDVLGKPFIADLDDLQVRLNQYITLCAEVARRLARPPLAAMGDVEIDDDGAITDDDVIVKVYGSNGLPQFLVPNAAAIPALMQLAEDTRAAMFRLGSWQAASRGEANAGDPAAKVVALARADDSNLATVNQDFRTSAAELMQLAHALAKQNMTVPMTVKMTGDEYGYMAKPYIEAEQMSESDDVQYVVVSGYGTTPEQKGQQLLQLVGMKGMDGKPLLDTDRFWKLWPDPSLRPEETGSGEIKIRRAQAINYALEDAVEQGKQRIPNYDQLPPQWQQYMSEQIAQQADQSVAAEFNDILRDDDPQLHIDTLSRLTQDPSQDPVVRRAAVLRQGRYYNWLASFAVNPNAAPTAAPQGHGASMHSSANPQTGGSATSQAVSPQSLSHEVHDLTTQAGATGP